MYCIQWFLLVVGLLFLLLSKTFPTWKWIFLIPRTLVMNIFAWKDQTVLPAFYLNLTTVVCGPYAANERKGSIFGTKKVHENEMLKWTRHTRCADLAYASFGAIVVCICGNGLLVSRTWEKLVHFRCLSPAPVVPHQRYLDDLTQTEVEVSKTAPFCEATGACHYHMPCPCMPTYFESIYCFQLPPASVVWW